MDVGGYWFVGWALLMLGLGVHGVRAGGPPPRDIPAPWWWLVADKNTGRKINSKYAHRSVTAIPRNALISCVTFFPLIIFFCAVHSILCGAIYNFIHPQTIRSTKVV